MPVLLRFSLSFKEQWFYIFTDLVRALTYKLKFRDELLFCVTHSVFLLQICIQSEKVSFYTGGVNIKYSKYLEIKHIN